jgi:hypothetical protein
MPAPPHVLNWVFGWGLVLSAFVTGALIGLFFHRDDFLGGYASFSRRLLRLGHIAQAALGMMNVLYGLSPWPVPATAEAAIADWAFVVGGVSMPAVCFLSAWKEPFRHLFFIPVTALIVAAVATLRGVPCP